MKKLLVVLLVMLVTAAIGFAQIPETNRSLPMQACISQIEMCTDLPYGDTFVFGHGAGDTLWFVRTKHRYEVGWRFNEAYKLHTKAQY